MCFYILKKNSIFAPNRTATMNNIINKLRIGGIPALLVATTMVILILAVQYYISVRNDDEDARKLVNRELIIVEQQIMSEFKNAEFALEDMADRAHLSLADADKMLDITHYIIKENPNIKGAAIAFVPYFYPKKGHWFEPRCIREDNEIISEQIGGIHHDYTKLNWYREGIKNKKKNGHWSNPYIDDTQNGIYILSLTRPLHQGKKVVGVLCIDMELAQLEKILKEAEPYPGSICQLINDKGEVLISSGETKSRDTNYFSDSKKLKYSDVVVQLSCPKKAIYGQSTVLNLVTLGLLLLGMLLLAYIVRRTIYTIASAGQGEQGKVGGIFQAAGGVSTFVGTILSTVDVALDSSQNFEGSAKVNFDTKGSLTGTIEFNTINGLPGITFSPVAFKYNWNTLMSDNPTKWATDNTQPTFGLMNTISSPVVYVSADHLLYTPAEMTPLYQMESGNELISCESGDDEEFRYISFLDPSSVEMFFNKEMMGYDFEHAEISVSLTANAGPYDQYIAPTPYFGYYQLQNDQIQLTTHDTADDNVFGPDDTKSMKFVAYPNSEIPTVVKGDDADLAATYNVDYKMSELPCFDKSQEVSQSGFTYRYYGLTADFFNGNRKVIVDPIIYVPTNKDHLIYNKSHLGPVYVTVVARLTKSDNSMQIISKHYLPNIRAFKSSEISDIKSRISGYNPTTVKTCKGTASADYIDNDWLKARALKMLELAGK